MSSAKNEIPEIRYLCPMKISFFALIFAVLVISSCEYSKEPVLFTNDILSIEYPSYLSKNNAVYPKPDGILELANDYRDVYFFLADIGPKPGPNGFEIMYDSLTTQLKNGIKESMAEKDTSFTTANGLKTREFQVSGIVSSEKQDKRVFFILNLFEDQKGHLYQTTGWLFRHKRNLWEKDLHNTAYSLKMK
jgi:hypothetical protein